MRSIALKIAYDGTAYVGWQVQTSGATIQQVLQDALRKLTNEQELSIIGSGRTDSGVHALAQVASFSTKSEIPLRAFHHGLNSLLPNDIEIVEAVEVPTGFHAQRDAVSKTYVYYLSESRQAHPIVKRYAWHFARHLDRKAIEECLTQIQGEHDFTSFAAVDSAGSSRVRTLTKASIGTASIGLTELRFSGNGFLKQMVRNLVGTIIDVGTHKTSIDEFAQILAGKDRSLAGATAPGHGLYLLEVEYGVALWKQAAPKITPLHI